MNRLKKTALAATLLFSSAAAFAFSETPTQCPGAASIKAAGLDAAYPHKESAVGKYALMSFGSYGTSHRWAFIISDVKASSGEDAIAKASELLPTLSDGVGPIYSNAHKSWGCLYSIRGAHMAAALTPVNLD